MKILLFVYIIFVYFPTSLFGQCFLTGADLSYTNEILSNGSVYKNEVGELVDPYAYFASRGSKIIRLRLWHTPSNIIDFCGHPIHASSLEDVLDAAAKVKSNGMQLMLSIHYSDYFADPGKQKMPKAWQGLLHVDLLDSISNYTNRVLNLLHDQNTLPDIVSIGNETTWGFIDETPTTNGFEWNLDGDKFNAALSAIDSFNTSHSASVKKAVHFTESSTKWVTKTFVDNGVNNFEIIGFSYYPSFSSDISLNEVGLLINELTSLYDKEVMIFETGFAWTNEFSDDYPNFISNNGNVLDFPTNEEGQKEYLLELAKIVAQNNGTGLLYWEPSWVTSDMCDLWGQGSSYENVAMFSTQNKPLASFDFFKYCDSSLGTFEEEFSKLNIYPNPLLLNDLSVKGIEPYAKWEILDLSGRLVLKGEFGQSQVEVIKVPDFAAGLYFLRAYSLMEEPQVISFFVK